MAFRAPPLIVVLATLLAGAVLVWLGVWQLNRNGWKQDLVASRTASMSAAPADATTLRDAPPEAIEYRRASASGVWDHDRTFTIASRIRFQTRGEEVVTPLLLAPGGPALLVNRGWFPLTERDRVLAELRTEERADVEGLARYVDDSGGRELSSGSWTRINTEAIGAALPYEVLPWHLVQGELVDSSRPTDRALPVQGYPAFVNTTPHIEYALTWFGLAIVLLGTVIARFVLVRGDREGGGVSAAETATPHT